MIVRITLVLVLVTVAQACAVAPQAPSAEPSAAEPSPATTPSRKPGADIVRPAAQTSEPVMRLLAEASRAERSGDLALTESLLERALRIEPQNPVLWHYLARMRLKQGQFEQAGGLALKSNSLAAERRDLLVENWRLIAQARWAQGDDAGARAAQEQADRINASR